MSFTQKIKDFFKKFYPVSVKVFVREINGISRLQQKVVQEIQSQQKVVQEIQSQQKVVREIQSQQKVVLEGVLKEQSRLKDIELGLGKLSKELSAYHKESNNKILYYNLTEREALGASFRKIMLDADVFEMKFKRLMDNLDKNSMLVVSRILCRMQKIIDGNKNAIDLFTEEEQHSLRKMKDDFSINILSISDRLYFYDGYYLPVNLFDSSVFYSKYGLEYINNIEHLKNRDIIDAGGYVGDTALILSPLTERSLCIFEAAPDNYEIVKQTMCLNHIENAVIENMALGEESGIMAFSLGERNSCNTLVERPGYFYPKTINVQVVTLDDYVAKNNLNVGLIKVDIEGAEQMLLRGAIETIKRFKPTLLISIYHSADDFFDIKPFLEDLDVGYKFDIVKPVNSAIVMETLLIAQVPN